MMRLSFCTLNSYCSLEQALIAILNCSRSQIKKFYSAQQRLKKIAAKQEIDCPIDLINFSRVNPNYNGNQIQILTKNSDFLIFHKPIKVHSTSLNYTCQNNIECWLRANGHALPSADSGLLYRLDYETSGLMIVCLNIKSYQQLRQNFQQLIKHKTYLAVVTGHIKQTLDLQHFLELKKKKVRVFHETSPHRVMANLNIDPLAHSSLNGQDITLVKIQLQQGHRHQIRAQLAACHYPILGEQLYATSDYHRLMLHAYSYQWQWNHEDYSFLDDQIIDFELLFPDLLHLHSGL